MMFSEMKTGESYEFDALIVDLKARHTPQNTLYYAANISDGKYTYDARIWDHLVGEKLVPGHIYYFKAKLNDYGGKPQFVISSFTETLLSKSEQQKYYKAAPLGSDELEAEWHKYVDKIHNEVLKMLVIETTKPLAEKFFTYPAAVTMHHNYRSGLVYHTISMARLADQLLVNYPAINSDLLYAGILLHDIGKTVELNAVDNPQYSIDGVLLGHIVVGLNLVSAKAKELGVDDTEEGRMLLHLIASHHGELEFGSPKTPQTIEAWALHLLDLTDSKLAGMNPEVELTKPGEYTQKINSIGKALYKVNIK